MLKEKKGITLISLIIYVTAMTMIIAVIANISRSFYMNVSQFSDTSSIELKIEKFNTFFLKQINTSKITINSVEESNISFSDGTEYVYDYTEKTIYYKTSDKNVKLCEDIHDLEWKYDTLTKELQLKIFDGIEEKIIKYKKK